MSKKLIVKNVYLFSTATQKAKKVSFTSGINIVTSDQEDGNKKGKSLILKSIYYALGADVYFDDNLKKDTITFVVDFTIDNVSYTILRLGRFFKLFDSEQNLLIGTDKRDELAEALYPLFDFSVYLPSRKESDKKLIIAPPAFAYMLSFTDQDHMDGSKFGSFTGLGQFIDFKESLLYTHFGLFNTDYFNLKLQQDNLNEQLKLSKQELTTIANMLEKIGQEIPEAIPENVEALRKELDRQESEYRTVYFDLQKTKNELSDLRSNYVRITKTLEDVSVRKRHEEKDVEHVLHEHTCPLCRQDLEDTLDVRIVKNINIEDLSQVSLELQSFISSAKRKIEEKESVYKDHLKRLNKYNKILKSTKESQNEILKIQGYSDLKTKLEVEWSDEDSNYKDLVAEGKALTKKLNEYSKKKKDVNSFYFKSMKQDIVKFGLEEVHDKSIENIKNSVKATGSNQPIVTVIWYMNLLKLKNEFFPESIKFPLVMDSPNHAELDNQKKETLFEYIFENIPIDTQCIISTLGFSREDYDTDLNLNIIILENEKYQLMNTDDYKINKDYLNTLIDKL
ncbi:hypothetical protein IV451_13200 [Enterococcus faecalis]|uniref:hypothetical protein n=1 Tax=Enterococcus faecalis TaxID=1351 RepID=UPI000DE823A7|nr:hypothetical protein [Enterococcus faecalis]EGO2658390.1 hypothetical protein [Enterococcus faecalis]EHQ2598510.1 hypothetical protein [Enterococcus faecalis]EHQ8822736.1 hypothetical protein [Enterococcus faecalis]EIW2075287.1 hypothetical protein [Enterococcus faecalis]EKI2461916.1 hypothetical protein [Enterococcus faecalis]